MKNKVYVERYADRFLHGDAQEALVELMQDFIREYNSEITRRRVRTDVERDRLIGDLNRKGNELADMMHMKTGQQIFKPDWFHNAIHMILDSGCQ